MAKSTKERVKGHQWLQAAFQIPQVLLTGTFQLSVNREERVLTRSSSSDSLTATGEQHTPFTHTHVHASFKFPNQMNAHVCGNVGETGERDLNRLGGDRTKLELNHQPYCYGIRKGMMLSTANHSTVDLYL